MPSTWKVHLSAYRAANPQKDLKTCMQEASKTYRSSSSKAPKTSFRSSSLEEFPDIVKSFEALQNVRYGPVATFINHDVTVRNISLTTGSPCLLQIKPHEDARRGKMHTFLLLVNHKNEIKIAFPNVYQQVLSEDTIIGCTNRSTAYLKLTSQNTETDTLIPMSVSSSFLEHELPDEWRSMSKFQRLSNTRQIMQVLSQGARSVIYRHPGSIRHVEIGPLMRVEVSVSSSSSGKRPRHG